MSATKCGVIFGFEGTTLSCIFIGVTTTIIGAGIALILHRFVDGDGFGGFRNGFMKRIGRDVMCIGRD